MTPEYRRLLEAALVYSGFEQTVDDVVAMVDAGEAQLWPGAHSVVVTQIDVQPQAKVLHFFLAGGIMQELEAMTPIILEWGVAHGCTKARLVGRKGWARSFLMDSGWHDTGLVILEKRLNG